MRATWCSFTPLSWDTIRALREQRRTWAKGPLAFPNEDGEVGSLRSVGHFVGR
ncbi:hypothetical protein ENSA5_69960 [Enhygromyxa salina]|uniref:Uncharacterized protein n=1 Tax=Enhygromyxa salina TaxID=215803 RepID=A0A2S9XAL6_9BACT|nr:hypothetical protein [Enhygromyxa salina]PRP89889.1 hypothetical protein ENSA5_69960 [Enhygromyxa salina]